MLTRIDLALARIDPAWQRLNLLVQGLILVSSNTSFKPSEPPNTHPIIILGSQGYTLDLRLSRLYLDYLNPKHKIIHMCLYLFKTSFEYVKP
jgi:hypothetical protein